MRKQTTFNFENTYAKLPETFYQQINPSPVKNPKLIEINEELLDYFKIDSEFIKSKEGVSVLSGNKIVEGSKPIAMAYAGHQFGNFVHQLGDGRAVLLGEIISKDGLRFDLQLKGSGKTLFSRSGDGRAPLGPVIREYIVSEAMHYLGVPTSRSLAIVSSGESVQRETIEPGGILARVSSSHIRIGTFEFFQAKKDNKSLKILADYTIKRHYPEILSTKNIYNSLLKEVIKAQAKLVSKWMNLGFIHGVINTDNTSISGETIDYGPCAFMNNYDPETVYSFIDFNGRYKYGNQPQIVFWNLSRFAESLLPLINDKRSTATNVVVESLKEFPNIFENFWYNGMRDKIGFLKFFPNDKKIINSLLEIMYKFKSDFTITFRYLSESLLSPEKKNQFLKLFNESKEISNWFALWENRIEKEKKNKKDICENMLSVNPFCIPRNHFLQTVIDELVENDNKNLMREMISAQKKPFKSKDKYKFFSPPLLNEDIKNTFCGT